MLGPNKKNALLVEISSSDYGLLRSHLVALELRVGQYLHCFGDPVEDVFFLHSGLVATSMPLRDTPAPAAALVGADGVVGALPALAGTPAPSDAVVHISGYASRLSAATFRDALEQSPSLCRHVARYIHAFLAQSQQNAICHAVHTVEARICRWLLAIQARCGDDKVPLIQSTLAQMLGVRRTTVTLVAGRLESLGVIKCHRGYIQIVNQGELEKRSCECHAILNGYVSKLLSASADDILRHELTSAGGPAGAPSNEL